jgi:hypothetical protein
MTWVADRRSTSGMGTGVNEGVGGRQTADDRDYNGRDYWPEGLTQAFPRALRRLVCGRAFSSRLAWRSVSLSCLARLGAALSSNFCAGIPGRFGASSAMTGRHLVVRAGVRPSPAGILCVVALTVPVIHLAAPPQGLNVDRSESAFACNSYLLDAVLTCRVLTTRRTEVAQIWPRICCKWITSQTGRLSLPRKIRKSVETLPWQGGGCTIYADGL